MSRYEVQEVQRNIWGLFCWLGFGFGDSLLHYRLLLLLLSETQGQEGGLTLVLGIREDMFSFGRPTPSFGRLAFIFGSEALRKESAILLPHPRQNRPGRVPNLAVHFATFLSLSLPLQLLHTSSFLADLLQHLEVKACLPHN